VNHPKETAVALPRAERSPRQSRSEALIDAGAAIDRAPPKGDDIAFTHSIFCQVGLPRRQTEGASFKRQFGNAWICVSAGYLDEGQGPVLQPVPYGPAPRHLMAYMNTYAIRHRTREIPIGEDITDLLRLIGQENQGGNRYKTARLHLHALAASRVQLGYRGRTFNDQPIEQFDAWSSAGSTRNRRWPGVLLLSKSYYESLKGAGVPIDRRALRAIGGAALDRSALPMGAKDASRLRRFCVDFGAYSAKTRAWPPRVRQSCVVLRPRLNSPSFSCVDFDALPELSGRQC
jgi:hypothetical protein